MMVGLGFGGGGGQYIVDEAGEEGNMLLISGMGKDP